MSACVEYAAPTAEVADADPVIAAAHALRDTARGHMSGVTARVRSDAAEMRSRLDSVAERHAVRREVLVVDDRPEALAALVAHLSPLGVPLRAITHDRTAVAALRGLGADVVTVHGYDEAPGLWRRYRPAVTVIDEHLGEHSGTALAARLPREARVVVVTSHDGARDSLVEATRTVQARAVVRTDAGEWGDRLRDEVARALDEACG